MHHWGTVREVGHPTLVRQLDVPDDFGRVLVGVQATTDRAERKLNDFLQKLGYRYTEETHNETYVQFLTAS